MKAFQPQRIVGAGNLFTRHDAMEAAEAGVDYVFFGLIDRPEEAEAHPRTLDFVDWWAPLFETPCVAMAGATLASLEPLARAGADFVALREAVWSDPRGAAAAIADAERRLADIRLELPA